MPSVSVIIPTYNYGKFISQAIDSVLMQTYQDFEIIVVDDGSTDNTLAVLSQYKYNLRLISQRNQGLSAARNTGIRAASGEYIALLDSDDYWRPDKLEKQISLLQTEPEYMWVFSDTYIFDEDTNRIVGRYSSTHTNISQGNILTSLFLENYIATPTPIIHRDIFRVVGEFFDDRIIAEDLDMWLRIAEKYPVGYVDEPLAYRRIHSAMNTKKLDWKNQYSRISLALERAIDRQPEQLHPLRKQAIAELNIRTGKKLISTGNYLDARKLFLQATNATPARLEAYFLWLGCFMNGWLLDLLIQLRRRFKRN